MRKFKIGDEVLLLLLTEHSKLLMKCKGSYTVVNVSGPVDYRINVDGKVKIFHVNFFFASMSVEQFEMLARLPRLLTQSTVVLVWCLLKMLWFHLMCRYRHYLAVSGDSSGYTFWPSVV